MVRAVPAAVMVRGHQRSPEPLCSRHNGPVISALDAVTALGPALFEVVVEGRPVTEVEDVFVAEPHDDSVGRRGDLVLGVGVASPDEAAALVHRCAAGGASGLVMRSPAAGHPDVRAAAEGTDLLLVGLEPGVAWAHVVWLLRGVVDRAAVPASAVPRDAGDAGVHSDLFALADAAAAIVDAPVTVEDNQSRVLAYSSGQSLTDTARVSTIVGRRVPPEVVAHFRARGVFRRLARSSEPFLVTEGPDGTLPRLVVPVRAGDEWLGSIWAVVTGPVPDEVTAELRNAASVLALHLLRLRAQADVARRNAVERLRSVLREYTHDNVADLDLPPGPWRVAALAAPTPDADVGQQVDVWTATLRRHSWADPLLADVDRTVFAIVTDGSGPGSWSWLRRIVSEVHRDDADVHAVAGTPARGLADLPRSRAEAAETLRVLQHGRLEGPVHEFEGVWQELTVWRATSTLDVGSLGGPAVVLRAHDAAHGTAYVDTLRAWLAHPGEPQKAAATLHVHANTLRHRMKRLGEVVRLDLASPAERLALQLQLEALRVEPGPASGHTSS